MTPQAIIWDMDGTLIDSEPLHDAALSAALASVGLPEVENLHDMVLGKSADAVYSTICRNLGLTMPFRDWIDLKYRHYFEGVAQLKPMPGARAFWDDADAKGIPQAVASNSDRLIVDANLRSCGFARPGLVTLSRNDVRKGKPNPELFERAAWLLGADPEASVGIEDSITGASASAAAGLRTFLVGHTPITDVPEGVEAVASLDILRARIGV